MSEVLSDLRKLYVNVRVFRALGGGMRGLDGIIVPPAQVDFNPDPGEVMGTSAPAKVSEELALPKSDNFPFDPSWYNMGGPQHIVDVPRTDLREPTGVEISPDGTVQLTYPKEQ